MVYKNEVTIIGYNHDKKDVVIPPKIKGLPVIAIGEAAFDPSRSNKGSQPAGYKHSDYQILLPIKGPFSINSVVIPNSVKTIGDVAFKANSLTNVIIPDSVETIGAGAFKDNCLTNVVIPNSVKTIGRSAFADNQLTYVVIPNSVETIGDYAFYYNRLEGAKEPFSIMIYKNGVTIIGYNHDKKDVIIPAKINGLPVVAIDSGAFQVQSFHLKFPMKLTRIVIPESIKINEKKYPDTFHRDTEIIRKWKKVYNQFLLN